MDRIALGSKEYFPIRVADSLGNLVDLSSSNPEFDVKIRDTTTWVLQGQSATASGMTLLCLLDTTGWDVGIYEVFVTFTNIPEQPRLGPFPVDVS